jgi:hypothetical protein
MNSNSKSKKWPPYWLALIIGTLVTCILMNAVTYLYQQGMFYSWRSLGSPPSGAAHIINGVPYKVWVKTNSGQIYTTLDCEAPQICPQWVLEEDSSGLRDSGPDRKRGPDCKTLNNGMFPSNPEGKMIECYYVHTDQEFYFALMSDGSIQYCDKEDNESIRIYYAISTYCCPFFAAILITVVYLILSLLFI